jgi:hypothetical protein
MTIAHDRARLAEALRTTLDELCAPDLTLARANTLRPEVARLLEAIDQLPVRSPVADRLNQRN